MLGSRKVADVHQGDIEALHREITARGKPVRANRVLAVTSKMFSLALNPMEGEQAPWRNQAQGNPCKGVSRNPEEGHERFFSEAELAALSDALDSLWANAGRQLHPVFDVKRSQAGRSNGGHVGTIRK